MVDEDEAYKLKALQNKESWCSAQDNFNTPID